MARKGLYQVGTGSGGESGVAVASSDSSFRACTMALLVFILFCVLINVVAWLLVWGRSRGGSDAETTGPAAALDDEHTSMEKSVHDAVYKSSSERDSSAGTPLNVSTEIPVLKSGAENGTVIPTPSTSHLPSVAETLNSSVHTTLEISGPKSGSEGVIIIPTPSTTPMPVIKPEECTSVECKELGALTLATMGHNARPCSNFYDFACGGLRRNRYLMPQDYEGEAWIRILDQANKATDSSAESLRKFKSLIESCEKYDPEKDLSTWRARVKEEMMEIGEFSSMASHFSPNLTHLFLSLLKHDRPVVMDVRLDVDDEVPSRFTLQVLPWQLATASLAAGVTGADEVAEVLALPQCQLQAARSTADLNDIFRSTRDCMRNGTGKEEMVGALREAFIALEIFDDEKKINETIITFEEFLVLEDETFSSVDKATLRYGLQLRNKEYFSTSELTELHLFQNLGVDWSTIVQGLIGRPLRDSERIEMYGKSYFETMNVDIEDKYKEKDERLRKMHDALMSWWVLWRHWELVVTPKRWRGDPASPLQCTHFAARLMPDAAAAVYLRSFPLKERLNRSQTIENIFIEVQDAVEMEMERTDWLKTNVDLLYNLIDKARHMQLQNITHMGMIDDVDALTRSMISYEINETDFVRNAIKLMGRNRERMYQRIEEEPKENIWTHFIAPYETRGMTIYSLGLIVIPLGTAEKPFFSPEYPYYIQTAGIGLVVAHEVAHLFDLVGMKFHTNITDDQYKLFDNRIYANNIVFWHDVNIEYLNSTERKRHRRLPYEYVDSMKLKKNELQADVTGIRLAFRAFNRSTRVKKKLPFVPLDAQKGFFVHLAQRFCTDQSFFTMVVDFFQDPFYPPEVRVNNMMVNSDFYNTFNCSADRTDTQFPYGAASEDPPES